jgi:hypothetical protein
VEYRLYRTKTLLVSTAVLPLLKVVPDGFWAKLLPSGGTAVAANSKNWISWDSIGWFGGQETEGCTSSFCWPPAGGRRPQDYRPVSDPCFELELRAQKPAYPTEHFQPHSRTKTDSAFRERTQRGGRG